MWLRLDARPFSPRPPPPVAQLCSVASSTLRACPTPPTCSSSAMPFDFPLRPTSSSTVGRLEVSQIQAKCFRTCMGSQTPGAPARLAYRRAGYCLPPAPMASAHPTDIDFEARNPACAYPYQRSAHGLLTRCLRSVTTVTRSHVRLASGCWPSFILAHSSPGE